ncbi:MAG: hypothetical protein J7L47_05685, partial [Candidatus Odinarchaeota archaeon]|nr:hypothetical protein [Candidatus Odinarchaeota archaeon]
IGKPPTRFNEQLYSCIKKSSIDISHVLALKRNETVPIYCVNGEVRTPSIQEYEQAVKEAIKNNIEKCSKLLKLDNAEKQPLVVKKGDKEWLVYLNNEQGQVLYQAPIPEIINTAKGIAETTCREGVLSLNYLKSVSEKGIQVSVNHLGVYEIITLEEYSTVPDMDQPLKLVFGVQINKNTKFNLR